MKYLVASSGNTLESLVVKRFEHATWYLLVDDQMNALEAKQHHSPHDRHVMLAKAIREHVRTVVAGKFGEHTLKTMVENDLDAAAVHGMTAREAIRKIQKYDILLVSAADLTEEKERVEVAAGQPLRGQTQEMTRDSAHSKLGTGRPHHHLQQYGGRGH